jgi:CheY-like chemotaxis protein
MEGQITFESQYGKGTTFCVKFSLKTGKKIAPTAPAPTSTSIPQKNIAFTGRILVAEDNITNQTVIGRILQKYQCKYHIVANGNEVLDALRNATFDLILMDCQMPEMDGYTASKIIRASDSLQNHIPIVALTANAVEDDQRRCLESGMNDYLRKPIDKNALMNILLKYLVEKNMPLTSTIIDKVALEQFDDLQIEGSPDILVETIDSFLRTSPARIAALSSFSEKNDFAGAAREAHALKSGAMILGATQLGKLCQEMEGLPSSNAPEKLHSLLTSLVQIYEQSSHELTLIRDQQKLTEQKKAA